MTDANTISEDTQDYINEYLEAINDDNFLFYAKDVPVSSGVADTFRLGYSAYMDYISDFNLSSWARRNNLMGITRKNLHAVVSAMGDTFFTPNKYQELFEDVPVIDDGYIGVFVNGFHEDAFVMAGEPEYRSCASIGISDYNFSDWLFFSTAFIEMAIEEVEGWEKLRIGANVSVAYDEIETAFKRRGGITQEEFERISHMFSQPTDDTERLRKTIDRIKGADGVLLEESPATVEEYCLAVSKASIKKRFHAITRKVISSKGYINIRMDIPDERLDEIINIATNGQEEAFRPVDSFSELSKLRKRLADVYEVWERTDFGAKKVSELGSGEDARWHPRRETSIWAKENVRKGTIEQVLKDLRDIVYESEMDTVLTMLPEGIELDDLFA